MLKSLGTEFKVGMFTLVAAATLGYMLFVLSPDSFESNQKKTYYTILIDAAGIIPKTHVKTNGVTVGKVKAIELEANTTRIRMDVDADVKIPVGSKIEVRTRGLLGDVFLEIIRAADSGEYIKDGGLLPKSEDTVDMQALVSLVGTIAKDVKRITGSIAGVIGTDEGQVTMKSIIANIDSLTADLKVTSAAIRGAVGDRPDDMKDIVTNFRDGVAQLKEFSASLSEVLDDENKDKINRILASFDESMNDVKGASRNIKLIAEKVEKGEGTLGRLVNDDTAMAEIEGAIKDIREVLSPVRKLEIGVDYHGEFRKDTTTQHYFNLVMKTRPDRYYLIGLTDLQAEEVNKTTDTYPAEAGSDGQSTVRSRETVRQEQKIRFNLQMAKRWYMMAARFGLFESTGGFAGDLYLLSDHVRISLEAFNWKTKDNTLRHVAHVKTYVNILFFNHIYAMIGADDLTRKDPVSGERMKQPNWFVGAGLAFNDQDLKAIFGAAASVAR